MDRYNGWTNYETWAVDLWMSNDAGSYRQWQEVAYLTEDAGTLAELIKEYHEENGPVHEDGWVPSVYTDLLYATMSEVNWDEIARAWVNRVFDDKRRATNEE